MRRIDIIVVAANIKYEILSKNISLLNTMLAKVLEFDRLKVREKPHKRELKQANK